MRYVVTGATGCLGLNLSKRLAFEGHEVIGLGRNEELGKILSQYGARFIPLDLENKAELKTICQDTDVIFHCAALSSPWGSYKDFYKANVTGTQHIIEATPANSRLVYVSSPSIYFDSTDKMAIKEDGFSTTKPANHYIHTKLQAETLIDNAFQQQGLKVISLRPRAIFGPYDRSILPRLLKAERNGALPIVGNGQNIIDITFVDNVVESLLLAAQAKEQFFGKKYNITNDEPRTLISIIDVLLQQLQKPLSIKYLPYPLAKKLAYLLEAWGRLPFIQKEPRLTLYSASVMALNQTLDISAAKNDLNYRPLCTIDEGIQRFAAWYLSHA